jgi:protein-S-isoprenylcysteine O-methyltransferase Ste14
MLLLVLGEFTAVRSSYLCSLLPATLIYLELIVGPWEDRQMARDFGLEYAHYVSRTRKWLPRHRPGTTSFERNG